MGTQQKWDCDEQTSPTVDMVAKLRRTDLSSPKQTKHEITAADKQLIVIPKKSVAIEQTSPLAFERQIEQGQHSQFSEDEVLTLKGLPEEAFELGAILQHGTTYKLIDFLARLQVVAADRMAQDHAEQQVIERALDNKPKLRQIGRKRVTKKRKTRIELPELNTALVEVYRKSEKATHAAKDMAARNKLASKQAMTATNLWQASKLQHSELEQQLHTKEQTTTLALPPFKPTTNDIATQAD